TITTISGKIATVGGIAVTTTGAGTTLDDIDSFTVNSLTTTKAADPVKFATFINAITKGGNLALSDQAIAIGTGNIASGLYSNAVGNSNTASGNFSNAMGSSNSASGGSSTAVGNSNSAIGGYSTALGTRNTAMDGYSTAVGNSNTASGSS
ncbi:hypothetical protein RJJ65_37745, partial [Rhizobium hidalgonense]|nr:hypothetical protein [Rhizobium hidalgonense]